MCKSITSLIMITGLILGSPGPAPLALAATGATFGTRNGISFLIGILGGLAVAIIGGAVGIASLFTAFPGAEFAVQIIGLIYIIYIAQKIARAPILSSDRNPVLLPGMINGFILNLLNPKAYAAFFIIFSQFILPFHNIFLKYFVTGIICFAAAIVVDVAWLVMGSFLRPFFESQKSGRILRIIFAVLMIAAVLTAIIY